MAEVSFSSQLVTIQFYLPSIVGYRVYKGLSIISVVSRRDVCTLLVHCNAVSLLHNDSL